MTVQLKIDLGIYLIAAIVVLLIVRNALRVEAEFEKQRRAAAQKLGLAEPAAPVFASAMSPHPEPLPEERAVHGRDLVVGARTF